MKRFVIGLLDTVKCHAKHLRTLYESHMMIRWW